MLASAVVSLMKVSNTVLMQIKDVKKHFLVRVDLVSSLLGRGSSYVHAVDGISFDIYDGETLALVGESGCGKSTLGRIILGVMEPTSGEVLFEGKDIFRLESGEMKKVRRQLQIVFQDPSSSLNPRKTIWQILAKPYFLNSNLTRKEIEKNAIELLESVGMTPAEQFLNRYPHEFSGGQRQRIGIARALALNPRLIVADEPVSSLDVSVRAQILNLLNKLQERTKVTFLFITHDLAVVRSLATRVAVMYLGQIVELAGTDELFTQPLHPYTQMLLEATPIPNPRRTRARAAEGKEMFSEGTRLSNIDPQPGCRFLTRCPFAMERCGISTPELVDARDGHLVACYLINPLVEV